MHINQILSCLGLKHQIRGKKLRLEHINKLKFLSQKNVIFVKQRPFLPIKHTCKKWLIPDPNALSMLSLLSDFRMRLAILLAIAALLLFCASKAHDISMMSKRLASVFKHDDSDSFQQGTLVNDNLATFLATDIEGIELLPLLSKQCAAGSAKNYKAKAMCSR